MPTPTALAGIRVLDFSWVRAGPWATRWLGALGAEVIKVEWPANERGRQGGATTPEGAPRNLNTSGHFNDTNANKKSVTLNVRTEQGMALVKRLVGVSDVVIENFSSRVLSGWGLGYDELKRLKPDIVYVSMSGYGHIGRHHSYKTFGPVAQAVSGMTFSSGLPDAPPAGWGWSYLDDTGGLYGAMCVLTAVYQRNMTGRGQHVDQAQMVTGATLNGPALLDHSVNGRASRRPGYPPGNRTHWPGTPLLDNYRGPQGAPHNTYRTHPGGADDWCAITCFTDDEWRRLAGLMGAPDWAADPVFDTLAGRLEHQEALDAGIGAWTCTQDKYEITARCQAAGISALPVQTAKDRVRHDPQLAARGFLRELEHPDLGRRPLQNAPFRLSRTPASNHRPGPRIGEHTREVLEHLLGLDRGEIAAGFDDGTFWPTDMERYPYLEEMLR